MDYTPHTRSRQLNGIHDRVAHLYYSHGLFCSSHPYAVIFVTLAILCVCCYPLLHLPLLGSSSQQFSTPYQGFVPPDAHTDKSENFQFTRPRWFQGAPVGYIQQVIVKSAVSPWKSDLILTDAFRAPLADAFHLNELIDNHQVHYGVNNATTLGDICLQVSEPKDKVAASSLPHYGCLRTSPTNVWKNDFNRFQQDTDIIKTVFRQRDSTSDTSNFREILFGVPWKETGIKRLYVRNRPRVITYAVTIVFQAFNADFLQSLLNQLRLKYPSSPYSENITYSCEDSNISHIHFQDLHTLVEFVPLGVTYIILFLYIYFSFCKIDLVKSKWALAISAVLTLVMSLFMSVGLCLWFGLNPTLSGSEILPYLVVVIGLENMLVLTKSVVSTPVHLDVKLRVAQGLSKEGWSITKNLFTELALLTVAFLTFVPKIQEFCLFAVVGLLTDFFLQLVFFATFLSVDIRRMELSDLHKSHAHHGTRVSTSHSNVLTNGPQNLKNSSSVQARLVPPKPIHKSSPTSSEPSARIFAPPATPILKLPKRMRFIFFWARTRMIQRGLMVCVVVYIVVLVHRSGLVERLTENTGTLAPIAEQVVRPILQTLTGNSNASDLASPDLLTENKRWKSNDQIMSDFSPTNVAMRLKHHKIDLWQSLSPHHWTTLFGYYNISLSGRYISILPPIHLSVAIDPSTAVGHRNPGDVETSKKSHWQFLSSSEQLDGDIDDILSPDLPYHPSSPAEVALAIALAIPSLLFLVYLMVVLYRCMCTRHYAEWRSSWRSSILSSGESSCGSYSPTAALDAYLVMETLPVKLHDHSQELENITADNNIIVSCCLAGDICVYDALSGECLTSIKRSRALRNKTTSRRHLRESGSFSSDSTYGSSPPSDAIDNVNYYSCSAPSSYMMKLASKSHARHFTSKHFSFEGSVSSDTDCQIVPETKYDFSRFVSSDDCADDDCVGSANEETAYKNCTRLRHEYQLQQSISKDSEANSRYTCQSPLPFQSVWCIDYNGSCIAVGCRDGRLELWNAFSGALEYVYEESRSGITAVFLAGDRVVVSRLSGIIEFFAVEVFRGENLDIHDTGTSSSCCEKENSMEKIHCTWLQNVKAHSRAVSVLEIDGGLVVSGGCDHLVKVFRCDSGLCIYTLHGHTAPISALNIDELNPSSAASGCQDGLICLWDLMTGTCMYSLNAHQGAVTTLQLTNTYVVSQGADNRICIWEKCQGHLLHNIQQDYNLSSNFVLLTSNIMVTTKEDNLLLWDVNHGEALRMIMVGNGDHSTHIRLLRITGQSVVCDYGPQMFIINFPAVSDKTD